MNSERQKIVTEQIWRELSDRLRQFVRSRIASDADVDDVVQNVFLRIHSNLKNLRSAERLQSWVFQIARNAITDHFRAKQNLPLDDESTLAERDDRNGKDAATALAGCLAAMIEQLPDDQRRALTLYELEGVSQNDIAKRESISLSGAKSRVQRGRKSLEALLRACCEFHLDTRGNVLDWQPGPASCCDNRCE